MHGSAADRNRHHAGGQPRFGHNGGARARRSGNGRVHRISGRSMGFMRLRQAMVSRRRSSAGEGCGGMAVPIKDLDQNLERPVRSLGPAELSPAG